MEMETFVVVTDLCGRESRRCLPLSALDEADDLLDMMVEHDGPVWFLGEYEYREATETERESAIIDD